jgi:hypothetical protein
VLVEDGDCTFAQMMKAISAIAFGAMMLGQVWRPISCGSNYII